ncbi:ABC transporter substrate-binding protein [Sporomusa sp. KB1]|jgi:ABC-type nitrate/sulfonate/bicarbonate transport system substrate-binding protein|uniref:ABC transporter substrate-binding protein n=1 Tax=Sporomusa sp. KB1 TaxID=943346 RepID=UPI0011A7A1BF|nr:ABC transporter substrate-binding protein [Sporomusa sp. KB1]TWH47555.1 ABC-type nitrate/sulfonate/bicarbonate transport system substrate-binding protein [Sporomusa sp. KB1]
MKLQEKIRGRLITTSIAMLVVLTLLVAGCSKQQQASTVGESGTKQPDIIRVATPTAPTSPSIYYVGEELGFFAEQDIKIEYAGVVPSTQLVASVVGGKLDVGGAHINRTIAGISAGAKVKAVAAGTETSQAIPHMVGVTTKNSPIKTAQDMVGKKIGIPLIGGCNEYTPYAYMKKNGVDDPKSKVQIIVIPEVQLDQALRQGEIDLAMLHKTSDFIKDRGEFTVLFSDYDVWGTIGGNTPAYFSEKFIKEKPDVVKRFVAAVAKTNNWCNENPQKAIEITAKRANVDPKTVKPGYYAKDGIILDETVTVWIDLLTDFNEIKPGIKPEQVYTNEFNPNARN